MPTRNHVDFIAQAIASVLAQGIDGLELIVQDGASTDGTQALLAELAEQHAGLHWVSGPDAGPADAVNRAIARAHAPVIGWLNSDDLYTPGAIARALDHLERHPADLMVYGEAQHIDASGAVIGRYPTRGPQTPLAAWAHGCHICQPTAFFRREAFDALGGLDISLRTAFDYDFWLRLLKRYPGRVACLPEVQAQSRLHPRAITLRLREQVALEGLQVIHHHIGPAPAHWLLTHFDEVMAGVPFDGHPEPPLPRLMRLVQRAAPWLSEEARIHLQRHLASHRALRLATAEFFAPIHADGWAPPDLPLRVLQPTPPARRLQLRGRHADPRGTPLRLRLESAHGTRDLPPVLHNGPFAFDLPLPPSAAGDAVTLHIRCAAPFVPAEVEPGSTDRRPLAFLLESLALERAP